MGLLAVFLLFFLAAQAELREQIRVDIPELGGDFAATRIGIAQIRRAVIVVEVVALATTAASARVVLTALRAGLTALTATVLTAAGVLAALLDDDRLTAGKRTLAR